MTQKEVMEKISQHNEFVGEVYKIFNEYIRVQRGYIDSKGAFYSGDSYLEEDTLSFDDGEVFGFGYGDRYDPVTYGYRMPIHFLWGEDTPKEYMERQIKAYQDTLELKKKQNEEVEAKELAEQEQRDIAEFQRLLKKFGGTYPTDSN